MFEKSEMLSEDRTDNRTFRVAPARAALALALLAILVQGPTFATDPIDVDPDPDFTQGTTMIVVDSTDDLDLGSLPAGHYVIVVVAEDGSQSTFEIEVP